LRTLINLDKWKSLPPAFQQTLRKHLNEAAILARHDTEILDRSVQEKLSRQGLTFNAVNIPTFKAKLVSGGDYARWKSEFGDKAWKRAREVHRQTSVGNNPR
jgi:TRAP-type C4-dicarboxylate transport system substrate-binding protein